MWELREFSKVLTDFLVQCDEDMAAAIYQRLETLSERGSEAREPVSKRVTGSDGIFECRPRAGRRQARLLFFFQPGRRIIFVEAVWKDQRKLDKTAIRNAEQRKQLIETGKAGANQWN